MKKIQSIIKPFLSIILGALIFLVYLNQLRSRGVSLALGIIGVDISIFYMTYGILKITIKKFDSKKINCVLKIIEVVAYPVLFFVSALLLLIVDTELILPSGWVIQIASLVASLSFVVIVILRKILSKNVFNVLTKILAGALAIVFLTNVFFDDLGSPAYIALINIVRVSIYSIFTFVMADYVLNLETFKPKAKKEKQKVAKVEKKEKETASEDGKVEEVKEPEEKKEEEKVEENPTPAEE